MLVAGKEIEPRHGDVQAVSERAAVGIEATAHFAQFRSAFGGDLRRRRMLAIGASANYLAISLNEN